MAITTLVPRPVYDPALRIIHWWNALALTALLASAWSSELFERRPAGGRRFFALAAAAAVAG